MDSEEADNGSDSPNPPILGGDPTLSQFIENMGLHYEKYGVARIGGRILGLLMLTRAPFRRKRWPKPCRSAAAAFLPICVCC